MKRLELIAAKHFHKFAKAVTPNADWRYLSKERQLAWQIEIAETFITCLNELEKEIELPGKPSTGQVSFERGFLVGQAQENARLTEKITNIKDTIEMQLEALYEANKD
jgi:hypothetical protein